MTTPNTSAIYTVWSTLERLLTETQWPLAFEEQAGVTVWFGDATLVPPDIAPSTERVVLVPEVRSPDEQWGPIGNLARQERFSCWLYVITAIPGRLAVDVRARLEQLTQVVEAVVREVNAGRRTGSAPPEFSVYPDWHMAITKVDPSIGAAPDGAVGTAEIEIRCEFRVGTPPAQP